jgi:cobyrinic acid a,c-diamide synthase
MLAGWRDAGAQLSVFSPLNDEAPSPDANFIFLPGGYPELHLPTLTNATTFIEALVTASEKNIPIYGECGGFMMLGRQIIDAEGTAFPVAGLLPLETSFAARRLHLGYRVLKALHRLDWLGAAPLNAHEFHYTTALVAEGDALFSAADAAGSPIGDIGLIRGSVAGSYAHIIA